MTLRRTELSIVFKWRKGRLPRGYRYRSFSLLLFFYIVSDERERKREAAVLLRRTAIYMGVRISRDGLLCVDGDSRETDRNQADVTVRKVRGVDVWSDEERLKHGLVTYARISVIRYAKI